MRPVKTTGEDYDVIVVGSGAAGMTGALALAVAGLKVVVLEKSHFVGGTSAMSGADTWVAANHIAKAEGVNDSPEEALAYIENALESEGSSRFRDHWKALCDNGGPMLQMVMNNSPLDFRLTPAPDPIDVKGAKAYGRNLSPMVLPRRLAGPYAKRIRPSTLPHLFTFQEMFTPNPWSRPFYTIWKMWPELARRLLTGQRGQGSALMTGLIAGFIAKDGELRTEQNIAELLTQEGAVVGVRLSDGKEINAQHGVLIASGGFEWDPKRYKKHFAGKTDWLCTPDSNTGGGLTLAEKVGAALDQMTEANVHPALPVRYEGRAHGMPVAWHVGPSGIIVNAYAKRFVSEYDYNLGAVLNQRDKSGNPLHLPAWVICDRPFIYRNLPFAWYAFRAKGWIRKAPTLSALAKKIGLDPKPLEDTVDTFNHYCKQNFDPDFHRGEALWERMRSGNWKAGEKNLSLGGIGKGPYYAMPINRSILGTKGGPLTNAKGQVLSTTGDVIQGLYAAGNVMANPIGSRAISAGTTIGPHMTMGYVCAQSIISKTLSYIKE
ncbi:FAD-dependent oxidoreductase [Klebsiella pneumoniae]|uniref:FAD-dependent oxidoreductase n=1 Tax=Rahnella perminowiae TaxID=2816244 RepID=UPI00300F2635